MLSAGLAAVYTANVFASWLGRQEAAARATISAQSRIEEVVSRHFPQISDRKRGEYVDRLLPALRLYEVEGPESLGSAIMMIDGLLGSIGYMAAHDRYRERSKEDARALPLVLPEESYERASEAIVRLAEFELNAAIDRVPLTGDQKTLLLDQCGRLGNHVRRFLGAKVIGEHASSFISANVYPLPNVSAAAPSEDRFTMLPRPLTDEEFASILAELDRAMATIDAVVAPSPEEYGLAYMVLSDSDDARHVEKVLEIRERIRQLESVKSATDGAYLEVYRCVNPIRADLASSVQFRLDEGVSQLIRLMDEHQSLVDEIEREEHAEQTRSMYHKMELNASRNLNAAHLSSSTKEAVSRNVPEEPLSSQPVPGSGVFRRGPTVLVMVALLSALFVGINRRILGK